MQIKPWITTVGFGMIAGAAAVLMLPKHSEAYRMADDAAHTIKREASKVIDSMRN